MHYYKLIYDYEKDDNYVICDTADIGDLSEYAVISGKSINHWQEVMFKYDSSEGTVLTDYLANLFRWFVVSNEFREKTLDIICNQIQYLPVKLLDQSTGLVNNSYWVANIVSVLDALDLKKSKYDIFELVDEKIISIEKYALRGEAIRDEHIFKLKDDTIPIFVSEILKNEIEKNHLKGFRFLQVDVT